MALGIARGSYTEDRNETSRGIKLWVTGRVFGASTQQQIRHSRRESPLGPPYDRTKR